VVGPPKFTNESPIVKHFWAVLKSFTVEERRGFLQFAWARSRLPPEGDTHQSWRMKLNILETQSNKFLPSSETCFFNTSIPQYDSYEQLREKLLMAIEQCSSITS
jgi:hypothetical protein